MLENNKNQKIKFKFYRFKATTNKPFINLINYQSYLKCENSSQVNFNYYFES